MLDNVNVNPATMTLQIKSALNATTLAGPVPMIIQVQPVHPALSQQEELQPLEIIILYFCNLVFVWQDILMMECLKTVSYVITVVISVKMVQT